MKKSRTERRGCFSYLLAAIVGAGQLAATLLTALFKFLAWLVAQIIALGKKLWSIKFTLPLVGEGVRTNGLVALGGIVAAFLGLTALCNLSATGLRAVGVLPTYTPTPAPTAAPTATPTASRTPPATATATRPPHAQSHAHAPAHHHAHAQTHLDTLGHPHPHRHAHRQRHAHTTTHGYLHAAPAHGHAQTTGSHGHP